MIAASSFIVRRRRIGLLGMLALSTMFSLALLAARWVATGRLRYGGLILDVFLAWVPMGLALGVRALHRRRWVGGPPLLLLGLAWLLFFPNAPYLLTEFVHLGQRHDGPWWCDLILTINFAANGLVLGLVSLFIVQRVLSERFGAKTSRWLAAACLALCSFGVAMGRFLRFNSWDILLRPWALLTDATDILFHPSEYPKHLATALLLFAFLGLAYLILWSLVTLREEEMASF